MHPRLRRTPSFFDLSQLRAASSTASRSRLTTPSPQVGAIAEEDVVKYVGIGLDYDSCWDKADASQSTIESNKEGIQYVMDCIVKPASAKYPGVTFVVKNFSARQSVHLDEFNTNNNKNGSCFPAFEELLDHFRVQTEEAGLPATWEMDRETLADIFGDKEPGTNHQYALDGSEIHDIAPYDKTKFLLAYRAMHKLSARCKKGERAMFHPFDDRDDDILPALDEFFQQHHDLMPRNVDLYLHHYAKNTKGRLMHIRDKDGNIIQQVPRPYPKQDSFIRGTGPTDYRYRHNIWAMVKIAARLATNIEERILHDFDSEALRSGTVHLSNLDLINETFSVHSGHLKWFKETRKCDEPAAPARAASAMAGLSLSSTAATPDSREDDSGCISPSSPPPQTPTTTFSP